MSSEKLQNLLADLPRSVLGECSDCETPEALRKVLQKAGQDLDEKEAQELFAMLYSLRDSESETLDDELLEFCAGGDRIIPPPRLPMPGGIKER